MQLIVRNPWLPQPAFAMTPRSLLDATDCIFHHTAGSIQQTVHDIDREHRAIGDAMVGYNYLVDPKNIRDRQGNYIVWEGRPCSVLPAATHGRNAESVNISVIGQYDSNSPNFTGEPHPDVIMALKLWCVWIHQRLPIVRTYSHCDVAPMFYPDNQGEYSTACPGDRLRAQVPLIKAYAHNVLLAR